MKSALDLVDEHIAGPPVLAGPVGIPEPHLGVVELLQERDLVPPGHLCKAPLHNLEVGPGLGERPHVLEVARGHPHVREQRAQITGEPIHDLASPPRLLLADEDLLPDVPVEQHKLLIDPAQGTYPRRLNTLDQRVQGPLVVLGRLRKHLAHRGRWEQVGVLGGAVVVHRPLLRRQAAGSFEPTTIGRSCDRTLDRGRGPLASGDTPCAAARLAQQLGQAVDCLTGARPRRPRACA